MIVTTNDDGDVDEQDWASKKNAERKKRVRLPATHLILS